jgi:ribonuclease P protein component
VPEDRSIFRKRHRLSDNDDYRAVFDAKCRKSRGPLTIFAKPNGLGHARLGLSVSRKVGPAVRRVAIKRRLREAFRLMPEESRGAYDLVITVRKHPAEKLAAYEGWMEACLAALDKEWKRREGGGQ